MNRPLPYLVPAVLAAWTLLAAAAPVVSTNPDTPAALKVNGIVGRMDQGDGKSFENYYSLHAGPGTMKVRVTLRAGSNAGNVIATGQGDAASTGSFALPAERTLVVHVHGRAAYYHDGPHPAYRLTFGGDVNLDKTSPPLRLVNR